MAWHSALTKKHQTRRPNKFGATKVKEGGRTYDSKFERELHAQLTLMERAGLVRDIRHQVVIQLTKHVKWRADFVVFDVERGRDVIQEAKGHEDLRWRVIRQLLQEFAPLDVIVWKKAGNRIYIHEEFKACIK